MPRERGVLLVAAVIGNALLGVVSLAFGLLSAVATFAAAIDLADLTWVGVGRTIADQLGADALTALATFGIDPAALVAEAAAQAVLAEPGLIARAVLAALFVGLALFIESGVVALAAAHALWQANLASELVFVGGSDVKAAEAVYEKVRKTFFGPVRLGVTISTRPPGARMRQISSSRSCGCSSISSAWTTTMRSMLASGNGVIDASTKAVADLPSSGQCTTPCVAGMKASTRWAFSRNSLRKGVA